MRRPVVLLGLGSCLFATPAAARDGAWYVGGDFGAMIVEDVEFDFGAGTEVTLDHEYGYDGALFVGYDLGTFRLEAEVAYKRAHVDEIETLIVLPGMTIAPVPPQTVIDGGGRTSALSFMINGMLDFGDDDGISGFVGGGGGVARVHYSGIRAFENHPAFIDDSDTRFAWQIVAGVRQAVSDNIDVTVRYRFFNVHNASAADFGGFDSESRFRSHSVLGGITFNFGAPPN